MTTSEQDWDIEAEHDGDGDIVRIIKRNSQSPYHVALVYGHGGDLDTDTDRLAAAILIATAPTLLRAAQLVVDQWTTTGYDGRPSAAALDFLRSTVRTATSDTRTP